MPRSIELGALSQRLNAKQIERAQADARALLETRSKEPSAEQRDARSAYRLLASPESAATAWIRERGACRVSCKSRSVFTFAISDAHTP